MTMITSQPSKRALREAIASREDLLIEDPAFDPSWRPYGSPFRLSQIPVGASITVTNHPKRSFFATIRRTDTDTIFVK